MLDIARTSGTTKTRSETGSRRVGCSDKNVDSICQFLYSRAAEKIPLLGNRTLRGWQQCGSSRDRTEPNGTENALEEKLDFRLK
jgi:hypothetical protein